MKNGRQNGTVVVEASIIVTIVIFFVSAMVYLGLILYQRTMLSIVANQTAENIAQVYSNNLKDPFTGYIDADHVYQTITYTSMKTDAYMEVMEQKAKTLAKYRLESYRLIGSEVDPDVDVRIVDKPNELLKSQIVVTIRDCYDMPLAGLFDSTGIFNMAVSGRADCVDILEYINGVEAIGDPEHSNIGSLPDMKQCTVTFVVSKDNPQVVGTAQVLAGNSIMGSARYTHCTMPATPTWDNRQFSGWVTASGQRFSGTTLIAQDLMVYGTWAFRVTLHGEGGLISNRQETMEIQVVAGTRGSYPNASRDGYTFRGWYTGTNGTGSRYISNDTVITSDVHLYAFWECTHQGETGYTWHSRHGSSCVDNPYDLYRCQRCGAEKREPREGKHNTSGRCNKLHFYGSRFNGTCGLHDPGFGAYHVTCSGCGRVATDTGYTYVGNQRYDYWYWCGKHYPRSLVKTNTH